MQALNKLVLALLPLIPRSVMRRLATRYIAGETLDQALAKLAELARRGHPGIVDLLGEQVGDEAGARAAAEEYRSAASDCAQAGLDAYVSIKPTHFGLHLSEDLCFELAAGLVEHCRPLGIFVRVEMEDSPTVDGTLRVFERLRQRSDQVGIVLQARLFRTPDDIASLAPGPLDVRMVKGIYLEPAEIAHVEPEPIRTAFVACVEKLARRGARLRLATHDEPLGDRCLRVLRGLRSEAPEFEVLLGVQEPLWERWKKAGHTVRVYVPYGPEWRPYSQRRLRKNPQILRHVMRDALRLSSGRRWTTSPDR